MLGPSAAGSKRVGSALEHGKRIVGTEGCRTFEFWVGFRILWLSFWLDCRAWD